MSTGCIMAPVKDETDVIPQVPPGFVSLKSFTLQRVQDSASASAPANNQKKSRIDDENNEPGALKLRKSLRHRPWVNYSQLDTCSDEEDSILSDQNAPSIPCLPKGVRRGCAECVNCQKVIARWRPEGSRRPTLDESPVFHPSEEEFKDTLKYISSIRPIAEPYGVCRIVPPPSWKPSCPLKEQNVWESSTFTTRIQRVDKLQNRDTVKKFPTSYSAPKKKRRLEKMKESCRENDLDPLECLETGPYSQRFGFAQGPDFSLQSFQKYADYFKEQYFSSSLSTSLSSERWEPSIENIEGEYWRIVECPTEEIEVLYGADLETGVFGSGFPKVASPAPDSNSVDWANSSWNLNNVSRLPGSVLAFESGNISGVLVPWLYAGMCFSSFCWHVEDHHLYSVNYLHWGAPKIWYGVPGREALNLEAAMKKHLPNLFEEQPNLLHKLVTQFSPSILKLESVPVYRCVQQPGEFVLTFPRAYHSGFNCGFNCAEAVNIAPVDWLPHGQNAVELYREQMRKITISHDKLLLGAAREAVRALWNVLFLKNDTLENRAWKDISGPNGILAKSLKDRIELERLRREYLCSTQVKKMESSFDIENERECVLCHYDLHLSAVSCPCSPDKFSCLIHAKHLCSCDWETRIFLFRYEIGELNTLSDAVGGKLSAVHKWGLQDLKLSLSSYINKDKSVQARSSGQAFLEVKDIDKVKLSKDFSVSLKNTSSALDAKASVLQESVSVSKASTKMLTVDSASVSTNHTTLFQHSMLPVSSASQQVGLEDNSLLVLRNSQNKTTEVTEFIKKTQPVQSKLLFNENERLLSNVFKRERGVSPNFGEDKSSNKEGPACVLTVTGKAATFNIQSQQVPVQPKICLTVGDHQIDDKQDGSKYIVNTFPTCFSEPKDLGNGESSGNNSPSSRSLVDSLPQGAFIHSNCVNMSTSSSDLDFLLAKEVGEDGYKSVRSDLKEHCSGSSNSDEGNKAGKGVDSDACTMKDNGESAEICSSLPINSILKRNNMQKGPRVAKVVRRINCSVELLECGVALSGRLWCTSRVIFPKGFKSRVRYWSTLNPTQMCYYISEILDAGLIGPLFMVKLEQSPSEVFFHMHATNCWNIVRERVNSEIRRLYSLGKVNLPSLQPPGSVDGLEMFGFTSPAIIEAIEAIDKNHVCTEYWSSHPKPEDQQAVSGNAENHGLIHSVLAVADSKLKSLFKKASSDELHALLSALSSERSGAVHQLLDLIKEEKHARI